MGFLDSFNKSFKEASKDAENRRASSTYKTVLQSDSETYNKYNSKNDGELISLSGAVYLSEEDKNIIDKILRKRGYKKDNKGYFKGSKRLKDIY